MIKKKLKNLKTQIQNLWVELQCVDLKIKVVWILYFFELILSILICVKLAAPLLLEILFPSIVLGIITLVVIRISKLYEKDSLIIIIEVILFCVILCLIILFIPINFSVFDV